MNRKGESGEMVDEKRSRRTEDQDEGVQQTEQDYEEVERQNETELQLKNKTLLLNYNNLNREFKKKVASEVDMQITINENFKMQLTWKKNSCRLFRVQSYHRQNFLTQSDFCNFFYCRWVYYF